MRTVNPFPAGVRDLDLERRVEDATRRMDIRVIYSEEGIRIENEHFGGGHYFFHHDYNRLEPGQLFYFPRLFEQVREAVERSGIPPELKPSINLLMADNERKYSEAALNKIPAHIILTETTNVAGPGTWGIYDYESVKAAAKQSDMSVRKWLARNMPMYMNVGNQRVLRAPLRTKRPGGALPPSVLESIHFGFPRYDNSVEAIRDLLFHLQRAGRSHFDDSAIDEILNNPDRLTSEGIGQMVNGSAIVLSFDSETHNKAYPLDYPSDFVAKLRDLSVLGILGEIDAITIVNRFSAMARLIYRELDEELRKARIIRPDGPVDLTGKLSRERVLAEGVGLVAYSTGLETSMSDMPAERIAKIYRSLQLALRRIVDAKGLSGYEKASIIVGCNEGDASTLKPVHTQAYASKFVKINPTTERISKSRDNVVFDDGAVALVAHPSSYGLVQVQFAADVDFLERTYSEIVDFATALKIHLMVLDSMGIKHRNTYMQGNDFVVRPLTEQQRLFKVGFFDMASGWRVISDKTLPMIDYTPGNQKEFVGKYRQALKDFQWHSSV